MSVENIRPSEMAPDSEEGARPWRISESDSEPASHAAAGDGHAAASFGAEGLGFRQSS